MFYFETTPKRISAIKYKNLLEKKDLNWVLTKDKKKKMFGQECCKNKAFKRHSLDKKKIQ